VCAKSVKPRLRAKRTEDGSEDEGDEDDVDVEDDKPSGTLRPEKQRRWDHLRKIHHVRMRYTLHFLGVEHVSTALPA
jgi:hypothetical protein